VSGQSQLAPENLFTLHLTSHPHLPLPCCEGGCDLAVSALGGFAVIGNGGTGIGSAGRPGKGGVLVDGPGLLGLLIAADV